MYIEPWHPGLISTNILKNSCGRKIATGPTPITGFSKGGLRNFTQGSVLDSPTSNQDTILPTTVRKLTITALLLVEEMKSKWLEILSETQHKTKNEKSRKPTSHSSFRHHEKISPGTPHHPCLPLSRTGSMAEDLSLY